MNAHAVGQNRCDERERQKAYKTNEKDKKHIKQAINEVGMVDLTIKTNSTETGTVGGDAMQTVLSGITNFRTSVVSCWEKESEQKFVEALPSPDK